jgi:hypothetical protein
MYSSLNIIWVITSRRNGWQVWGRGDVHRGFWWGNLKERDHLEDLNVEIKIILKLIFSGMGAWTGLIWVRIETGGGPL